MRVRSWSVAALLSAGVCVRAGASTPPPPLEASPAPQPAQAPPARRLPARPSTRVHRPRRALPRRRRRCPRPARSPGTRARRRIGLSPKGTPRSSAATSLLPSDTIRRPRVSTRMIRRRSSASSVASSKRHRPISCTAAPRTTVDSAHCSNASTAHGNSTRTTGPPSSNAGKSCSCSVAATRRPARSNTPSRCGRTTSMRTECSASP